MVVTGVLVRGWGGKADKGKGVKRMAAKGDLTLDGNTPCGIEMMCS